MKTYLIKELLQTEEKRKIINSVNGLFSLMKKEFENNDTIEVVDTCPSIIGLQSPSGRMFYAE